MIKSLLNPIAFRLAFLAILSSSLLWSPVHGQNLIWGVKSHDPLSQPPATLFSFTTTGAFSNVGVVKLDNTQIDVDGLAMNSQLQLYGFKVTYPAVSSQLILIDKTTANATAVGPVLTDRDIRGATFDHEGRLLVLDAAQDKLLQIDPATGEILETLAQLDSLTNLCDITQQRDGTFMIVNVTSFTRLTLIRKNNNVAYDFYTETNPGQENFSINMAGLAVADFGTDPDLLYMFDVGEDEDIYTYQYNYDPQTRFNRQTLIADLIPNYNAGRGDIAAPPVTLLPLYPRNQWPSTIGGNDHLYQAVRVIGGINWQEARDVAIARKGYLATIHSLDENTFCYNQVNSDSDLWYFDVWDSGIGPWLGGREQGDGNWLWDNGDPWSFTRWAPGEPNNFGGDEAFLHFFSNNGLLMNDTWNDVGSNVMIHGYIVEWTLPTRPYNLPHYADFIKYWLTTGMNPHWIPVWDLNNDDSIDVFDLNEFL